MEVENVSTHLEPNRLTNFNGISFTEMTQFGSTKNEQQNLLETS